MVEVQSYEASCMAAFAVSECARISSPAAVVRVAARNGRVELGVGMAFIIILHHSFRLVSRARAVDLEW